MRPGNLCFTCGHPAKARSKAPFLTAQAPLSQPGNKETVEKPFSGRLFGVDPDRERGCLRGIGVPGENEESFSRVDLNTGRDRDVGSDGMDGFKARP